MKYSVRCKVVRATKDDVDQWLANHATGAFATYFGVDFGGKPYGGIIVSLSDPSTSACV